ncbi:UNVERIFIED_CONTAM: hypothetical protein HDU68_008036 [Siphonaria sp. JEL0065]|nr:hypothetical protein HDU68_008036 [Siphonaria sp. JEL0065]
MELDHEQDPEAAFMKHRPREYQSFIFNIAKTTNTIVVLPTGTGKTLISLLLIKHVAERDFGSAQRKVSIFLAPQATLVLQQTNYLKENCDFPVKSYHGELGCDHWSERTWKKELEVNGCLVMTPAILDTVLRRGYLSMKNINLIVFDECHNARKNSIYNQIIALHYLKAPDAEKPLIFGMTASPISGNGDDIQTAIKQLEANLCSKAITPESHSDLKHYVVNPEKIIVPYPNVFGVQSPVLLQLVRLGINEIGSLRSLCFDAQTLCEDIAPWVADAFLREATKDLFHSYWEGGRVKKRKKEKLDKRIGIKVDETSGMVKDVGEMEKDSVLLLSPNSKLRMALAKVVLSDPSSILPVDNSGGVEGVVYGSEMEFYSPDDKEAEDEERLKQFVKAACTFLDARWSLSFITIDDDEPSTSLIDEMPSEELKRFEFQAIKTLPEKLYTRMSPKFLALVGILEPYASDDGFCGICFTEKRCSAKVLGYLLPRCPTLKPFVRVEGLVGHGADSLIASSSPISFSMDVAQQKKVVHRFRDGKLNLLIATKVAEEGIDIQPCNVVVRFDMVQTVISNIQSRGRARHKNSKYVVMVNESNFDAQSKIAKLEQNEAQMNFLLLGKMKEDLESQLSHDIAVSAKTVYETPIGSKMTIFNSVQAIFQYCMTLPQDYFSPLRPIFNTGPTMVPSHLMRGHKLAWISSLQLPLNAPVSCRFISGQPCLTFSDAKRMVALEAVKMLHKAGVYNDTLKLSMYDAGPTTDDADYIMAAQAAFGIRKVSGEGRISEYETMIPEICQVSFPSEIRPESVVDESVDDEVASKKPKYRKRSEVPVVTSGYLVLFRVFEEGSKSSGRVLDIAALLPFLVPDASVGGKHALFIDSKEQVFRIFASQVPIPIDLERSDLLQKFSTTIFFNALLRTPQPPLDPENDFLMPVVPLISGEDALLNLQDVEALEHLIDWMTLKACAKSAFSVEQQRGKTKGVVQDEAIHDFVKLFEELGPELVVVDRKYYNRRYQILNVITNRTPWNQREKTTVLAEFYKRRLYVKEKIFENQVVLSGNHLPNMYQTGAAEVSKDETSFVNLIPQFCTPFPIKASVLMRSALHLPMLIQYLYHRLSTLQLQRNLAMLQVVPPINFQTAFLSSATQFLGRDFERLEFLGDSYLKMHLTLHLFVNNPTRDEGWLTRSRTALERNSNLKNASLANGLPGALLTNSISRKTWYPPQRYPQRIKISDKGTADVVEAIIGACIEASGIEGGGIALNRFFGPTYSTKVQEYNPKMPYSLDSAISMLDVADEDVVQSVNVLVTRLHQKLGYKFENPLLAVEAVTHTSAIGVYDSLTGCFQRLEFLGDAILGFVVVHELYNSADKFDPGQLSTLKDELVCNQYLAYVSFKIGLHTLIKQATSQLAQDICDFGVRLEEASADAVKGEFYWNSLPHAPKTASDVLEALIGAVFVDSGCDYEVAKALVKRLVIREWWEFFKISGASIAGVSNPTREMAAYAEKITELVEEGKTVCTIEKHKIILASAAAPSKKLARRMAAVDAMAKLKGMVQNGDPNCDCRERQKQGLSTVVLDVFAAKDFAKDPKLANAIEIATSKIEERDEQVRSAVVNTQPMVEDVVLSDSEDEDDGDRGDDEVEVVM